MNRPVQAGPNSGGVPLPEEESEQNISLASSFAATSQNPSSGDLLQQGAITSAAVSPIITNAAQGQEAVQVHQDNNVVHLPAKRNSSENVSGEYQEGESSNMGEQSARAKRPATESRDRTDNNVENPSPPAPVTPQVHHFFSENPRTEPIRRRDGAFLFPHWSQTSEPVQFLSGYMDINGRVHDALAIIYHHQSDHAGPSSSRPSHGSQGMSYFGEASSSRTQNSHNQLQISASGIRHFFSYEPSLPLLQIPSAEARTWPTHEVEDVLDGLRRGRHLTFEELMLVDTSLVLDEFELADPNLFDASIPNDGLRVETIVQHMESETLTSVDKKDPQQVEKCPICQDEFENGDEIGKLHLCAHKFHAPCIKKWLMESNVCPICKRTALNTDNVQNEAGAGVGASEANTQYHEDDNA